MTKQIIHFKNNKGVAFVLNKIESYNEVLEGVVYFYPKTKKCAPKKEGSAIMTATKSLRNGYYKPHAEQQAILNRAYEHILSVPYKVSLRWLYYRIWQDNFFCRLREQTERKKDCGSYIRRACNSCTQGILEPLTP